MKIYLFILFSISELFASTTQLFIDNKPFTLVTTLYNEYGTKGEVLSFYKGQSTNKDDRIFVFVLSESKGSCRATSTQKGVYEINASNITFYTSWKRDSSAYYSPIGAKIANYKVLSNSNLEKVSSKVYIEESRRNYDKESGMQYLFSSPTNKEEKAMLTEYIEHIEYRYKGEFVLPPKSQTLTIEVTNAIRRNMKSRWGKSQ